MNFFAHATIAVRYDTRPAFVLGAMVPDFAGMARARPVQTTDAVVQRGISLHHATDSVFHQTPTFLRFTGEGLRRLTAEGVPRGPARAAAHVGLELLLDGLLVTAPVPRAAYAAAIGDASLPDLLDFPGAEAKQRFVSLLARLAEAGIPPDLADPDAIVHRLDRILSGRPRLRLDAACHGPVRRWLHDLLPALEREKDPLLGEVVAGLGSRVAYFPDSTSRDFGG